MSRLRDLLYRVFDFSQTVGYLHYPWVLHTLAAAALLGLVTGIIAPFVVFRGASFAVHGTSELGFTGAAAALLFGLDVRHGAIAGGILAALAFGILGARQRERDAVIGVILAFGMGLGVLMLSLYEGRAANKFGLLVGSIITVDTADLWLLGSCGLAVTAVVLATYRPLLFASVDPELAAARGVPLKAMSIVFALLVGVSTSLAVPIVGAVLVLALAVTPGASAARLSANPKVILAASVAISVTASVGGVTLSLGPGLPASPYITTLVFAIYLSCRLLGRRGDARPLAAAGPQRRRP